MEFRNNVTRLLESRNIRFTVHTYDYDSSVHSAVEVAAAIGLPPERVFKTLVALLAQPNGKPVLVMIPGPDQLDLKALAKATRAKKVKMASHGQAESLTGLQTGGISPLALLDKGFTTYLSSQALAHGSIAVSAGQRGANLEIQTVDLIALTNARVISLG